MATLLNPEYQKGNQLIAFCRNHPGIAFNPNYDPFLGNRPIQCIYTNRDDACTTTSQNASEKSPFLKGSFEAPSRFEHTKGLPHHPHQCQPTWHHRAQIPQRRNHLRCDSGGWVFLVLLSFPYTPRKFNDPNACSLCKRNSRHTHLFRHKKNGFVFTTQHRWNENVLQVASLYACDHFKKDLHECCFPFQ